MKICIYEMSNSSDRVTHNAYLLYVGDFKRTYTFFIVVLLWYIWECLLGERQSGI